MNKYLKAFVVKHTYHNCHIVIKYFNRYRINLLYLFVVFVVKYIYHNYNRYKTDNNSLYSQ
jgi:hypothetical protein